MQFSFYVPIRPATAAGAHAPIRSLRIIVALLAALQLAAPLVALAADDVPTTGHIDHVGAPDDGCHTFHDELFCLSCRVLTAPPAESRTVPIVQAGAIHPAAALADVAAGHPTSDHPSDRLARAPPRT